MSKRNYSPNGLKRNTLHKADMQKDKQPKSITPGTKQTRATTTGRKKPALLKPYSKIKSKTDNVWRILAHIGSGGFGDVYKCELEGCSSDEFFAMKTESHTAKMARLRIELQILEEITAYCIRKQCPHHFCNLMDSGNTLDFFWIVMTLIGPSLQTIRKILHKQFSKTTTLKMSLQILDALKILHDVGFIHRDLKPGNVCVGVPPGDDHVLYLLDFGISRRIYRSAKSRELRKERKKVPFFGTRKFCTRACHLELDQGRKDDVETWIYTTLDLLHNDKGLPWANCFSDPAKVLEKKLALFENPSKELHTCVPQQFCTIIEYVRKLNFEDEVDYAFIETEIHNIAKERNLNLKDKFDWKGRLEELIKDNEASKHNRKKEKDEDKGEETLMMERLQQKLKNNKIADEHQNDRTFSKDDYISEGNKHKDTETRKLRKKHQTKGALNSESTTKKNVLDERNF
ncbi:unnamed protein product [Caenorhabditis angaria]|uniref:non-specific serine/threonine protein kinase n=1 Tax=Caenorhabditis angaria TaxID=860376 RepID=A0A9P1III4_9PELO|nr:unnamed protein product [Caenorhabditis angaria]